MPSSDKSTDANVFSKRDLIALVAARDELNVKQAKIAVDAVLVALHGAIASEKKINLSPLGKIISKRQQAGTAAESMVHRVFLADSKS